jgi:hypothetical protein
LAGRVIGNMRGKKMGNQLPMLGVCEAGCVESCTSSNSCAVKYPAKPWQIVWRDVRGQL